MKDFDAWLTFGREQGWVSQVLCSTHDGAPVTEPEEAELEQGDDPCLFCIRLRPDDLPLTGGREGWS